MVSPLGIGALILAAIIGTVLMWRVNEPLVRDTVTFVEKIRFVFGLVFLGLAAYHLIRSGNPLMVLLAVSGFVFLTGYALVERPWNEVI